MMKRALVLVVGVFVAPLARAWIVDVPVVGADMSRHGGSDKVFAELKRANADWVELCLGSYEIDPALRRMKFQALRANCEQARKHGLVPCSRTWALRVSGKVPFTTMRLANGKDAHAFACPLDPEFRKMATDYVSDMVKSGVRVVILDDDLCYGNHCYRFTLAKYVALACTCPRHLQRIGEVLGETVTGAQLQEKVLSGGRNRWRDAWLKVNGDSLCEFAVSLRRAVDSVDPSVRMGLCGQSSLWDADGTDCVTVARLLAGGTRPFLRLISGPYWVPCALHGFRLQDVFEYNRLQASWCGPEIDVFGEGDPYPRPRNTCPASYLELYDLLLVANGGIAGDFKYMIDYYAPVGYETGYVDRHLRNQTLRMEVDKRFSGKRAVGVRVWQPMRMLSEAVIPDAMKGKPAYLESFAPSAGAFLADAGIPTTYEGEEGPSVAFGESARHLPEGVLPRGLFLDLPAARILAERGVDVGLRRVGGEFDVAEEHFVTENAYVSASSRFRASRVDVDPKAVIDSSFAVGEPVCEFAVCSNWTPAVYFYANAAGERFVVCAFDGVFGGKGKSRGYARARQIRRGVRWLTGKDLPAFLDGNPDAYLLAKRNATSMSVGVWNLFADVMFEPVVELDEAYDRVSFINCRGRLEGNRVILSDVMPFAFAGFEVEKSRQGGKR